MGRARFFDHFEDMIRHVHDEQGGLKPQAVFLREDGDLSYFSMDEKSRTDTALLLRDMIRLNRFPAYGVAFEALKLGSPGEEAALDSGEVILDSVGNDVRDFSIFLRADPDNPDEPDAVLFMYMSSAAGQSRVRAFEVVKDGSKKRIGRRVKRLEALGSEYANLYKPDKSRQ